MIPIHGPTQHKPNDRRQAQGQETSTRHQTKKEKERNGTKHRWSTVVHLLIRGIVS